MAQTKMENCGFCQVLASLFPTNMNLLQPVSPPAEKEKQRKLTDYLFIGRVLGNGAFSIVREGIDKQNSGNTYAIKIIDKKSIESEKALYNEIKIQSSLKHKNIIRLFATVDEADFIYLITEMAHGGELFRKLSIKRNFKEHEAKYILQTICEAIKYMHEKKVTHRDLKPENLLLSDSADCDLNPNCEVTIKIADFGMATHTPHDYSLRTRCGTAQYVAPEILLGKAYGTKVDMWSLGVIFYFLLTGSHPFHENDEDKMFERIKFGDIRNNKYWNTQFSKSDAKSFISNLICVKPEKRFSAVEALEHSYIFKKSKICLRETSNKSELDLSQTSKNLAYFNAKHTFRASILAVKFSNRMKQSHKNLFQAIGEGQSNKLKNEKDEQFDPKKKFKSVVMAVIAFDTLRTLEAQSTIMHMDQN